MLEHYGNRATSEYSNEKKQTADFNNFDLRVNTY